MASQILKHVAGLSKICQQPALSTLLTWVSQVGKYISQGICFPGGKTQITSDMGFPGRGTHITRDMCFPGGGTHITSDMGFPGRGTHITRDMCFPGGGTHITSDMGFPGGGTQSYH